MVKRAVAGLGSANYLLSTASCGHLTLTPTLRKSLSSCKHPTSTPVDLEVAPEESSPCTLSIFVDVKPQGNVVRRHNVVSPVFPLLSL